MTWAIDLDEVVFNFIDPYFEFLSKKYGKKIVREDLTEYSAESCGLIPTGSSTENLLEFWMMGGFKKLKYMPGAEQNLRNLINRDNVVFATARLLEFYHDTVSSLTTMNLGDIPLYFADSKTTKGDIVKHVNARYFIDDNPENINDVRNIAPSCITILMSTIPGAIQKAHAHKVVKGWY